MNLTIKTLKGGKFTITAEPTNTVGELKTQIESVRSEFPAANMKLIHSGKILKDSDTVESCKLKADDFIVCMVAKAKKKATPAAAPKPSTTSSTTTQSTTSSATPSTPAPAPSTNTATPAPSTSSSSQTAPNAPVRNTQPPTPQQQQQQASEFPAEIVNNLTSMGFPEAEAKACLRAANGNPDIAVEFLMSGIPPQLQQHASQPASSGAVATPAASSSSSSSEPLQALRNHPQLNELRRLVRENPSSLSQVISQIASQQPELLQEINQNQAAFLALMNEPVSESSTPSPPAPSAINNTSSSQSSSGSAPSGGGLGNMFGAMANPAQMTQMLSSMSPAERNQMAAMMGLSPEQLNATLQMIGSMPPEQFQQFVSQAMQHGGGGGGLGGNPFGGMGGFGGMPGGGGQQGMVLQLSPEEMAAVDRLTEMGFDRTEAAQAFMACDKNEALAANLLMDSAGDFGFGGGAPGSGGSGGNNNNNSGNNDDTEDMYD